MMSISHWGMFDAKDVRFALWPLTWANDVDTQFWNSLQEEAEFYAALGIEPP